MKQGFYVLILFFLIIISASCSETENVGPAEVTVTETAAESTPVEPVFPQRDYEGWVFNILALNEYNGKYYIDISEENGDRLNDAAYRRNLDIIEQFNIDILCTEVNDAYSTLKNAVTAGDSTWSLTIPNPLVSTAKMMADRLLYNINDLHSVDLSKPWWNASIVENFKIGDKIFFATGDYSITYQGFVVLLYNKSYIDDYHLENPYKTVFDGAWTVDQFTSMLKLVSSDIDGDGRFTKNDQFGYTAIGGCGYIFMFGCDQNITEPDPEGIPRLALNTGRMVSIVEKYYDIMLGGGIFGVPVLCDDPERTGIILEALNYKSYVHTRPEFFDTVLYNKCLRDEESIRILTLLHENKKCDFGFNFDTTGLGYALLSTVVESKKSTDFASYYQSVEEKMNSGFESLIKEIME